MTRTSTARSAVSPTRRTRPSSITRSNRDCRARSMSPISSSNSVPPLACSKRPAFALFASVKAPRAWPKSSSSMRCVGMGAPLIFTGGPARRVHVDAEHGGPVGAAAQRAEGLLPAGEADDAMARLAQAKHEVRGDLLVVLDAGDEGHTATSLVPDIADADVQEAEAVSI